MLCFIKDSIGIIPLPKCGAVPYLPQADLTGFSRFKRRKHNVGKSHIYHQAHVFQSLEKVDDALRQG